MYDNGANVVRMSFEGGDLLGSIVIVDSNLEVIRAADDPVLAGDKSTSSNGDIGELECLDDRLRSCRE